MSSRIELFGDGRGSDRYALDSVYLISPLACWDGDLWVDGRPVHEGSVRPGMLRMASSVQSEKRSYPADARALVIRIPEARLSAMLGHLQLDRRPERVQPEGIAHGDPRVRRLVGILAKGRGLSEGPRTLLTEGISEALLALLIEHSRRPRGEGQVPAVDTLTDDQVLASNAFIHAHLDRPPSIASWARHLGLNKGEFVKRFARTNGVTPYAWLMEQRVRHAQALLRNTEITPSEIALQLGFADQSHFTDAFSRRVGVSPIRWRREQRLRMTADSRQQEGSSES